MIQLYPEYQVPAFKKLVKHFAKNVIGLMVMATGLGKTIVAAFWAKREYKKSHKGLFLCHSKTILDQAQNEFRKVIGNTISLKSFYGRGGTKDWSADEGDIVFATFGSLQENNNPFFKDEFDYIIVDESHHSQADTYKEVIEYFEPKKLLGITATPDREDLKDIREIFGKEVVNYSLENAIANGWLSPVEYKVLNDKLSHWKLKKIVKEVLEDGKRVSIKQLNETIFIKYRDEEKANIIKSYAGRDKKVIIFCEGIDHANHLQTFFPRSAVHHTKKGDDVYRRKVLQDFRDGNLQFILAYDQLNEGVDIPDAEIIVKARHTDSKNIFFQQLGRGLRKIANKEKVIVLDFVGNCHRLAYLREMAKRIRDESKNKSEKELEKDILSVSGEGFEFIFDEDQLKILDVIRRINMPLYTTWQEASAAAQRIKGITGQITYSKLYKADPRLPGNLYMVYKDFPGFNKFLNKRNYYPTWQEASKAAQKIDGITSRLSYNKLRKDNPQLPSKPRRIYDDFPGWKVFLSGEKKDYYPTWQEASKVVQKIGGIISQSSYRESYEVDSKLPSTPGRMYDDFPGWTVFLGGENKKYYSTWQEFARAVRKIKEIKNQILYFKLYKLDSRLPSQPRDVYDDFPGWNIIFKKNKYRTYRRASIAVRRIKGIDNWSSYKRLYKINVRLPSNPDEYYYDFPGWNDFLGKKSLYKTWQEASLEALKIDGIRTCASYITLHRVNSQLPSNPSQCYKDFPGWKKFLGKE